MAILDDIRNTLYPNGWSAGQVSVPTVTDLVKKSITGEMTKTKEDTGPIFNGNKDPNVILGQIQALQGAQTNYSTSIMNRGLQIGLISPRDWQAKYPYSLGIVELVSNNKYKNHAEFVFPIAFQELTISTPFAINTTVTSRGILEEHNGAPLRTIMASGTTGILYNRQSAVDTANQSNLQSVFGQTLTAVDNLKSSLNAVMNGNPVSNSVEVNTDNEQAKYSGYYQMHLLRSFLELYAEIKKTYGREKGKTNSRAFRLLLLNRKDNVYYLITPKMFTIKKAASSPMEAMYQFQAVAWGTVDNADVVRAEDTRKAIIENNLNDYQQAIEKIRQARNVIANAKNLISSVKSDIETNIFGPVNNVILALSDAAAIPQQIADFPTQLRASFMGTIIQNGEALRDSLPSLESIKNKLDKFTWTALGVSNTADANKSLAASGVNTTALLSKSIDGKTIDQYITDINIADLPLTYEQQIATSKAIDDAADIDTNDVNKLITNINELSTSCETLATEQGMDSPYWDVLYACNDLNESLYSFLSSDTFSAGSASSLIEDYYINAAEENGISLQSHSGKIEVPFPNGQTLEWLAQVYLGDASRWLEIVSANNLKAPYIDEAGFLLDFVTNGSDRQINVNSINNLYVGQNVWIYSNNVSINKRKILALQRISDNNFIVTVDGAADLARYTTVQGAKMKAYLPNTVNSQKTIYIPVDLVSNLEQVSTSLLGKLDIKEELLDMAYVDIALGPDGDILIQQDGSTNLSYGVANLIQALILKFKIVAGQLLLHPDFGGGVKVGSAESDFSVDVLRDNIIKTVQSDPRFKAVYNLVITNDSGNVNISMTVETANNYVLPIGFSIS